MFVLGINVFVNVTKSHCDQIETRNKNYLIEENNVIDNDDFEGI